MSQQKETLVKRILSSLVLAPLAIGAVLYGNWPYHMLIALLFVISVREWTMMAGRFKHTVVIALSGIVYLLIGFASFVIIRAAPVQGLTTTIVLLVTVWASDIGAYMLGKGIGGARIAPKISPGKTYAGLAGAVISGALVPPCAALLGYPLFNETDMRVSMSVPVIYALLALVGFFIGITGQCGDFLMSFVKRKAGVKDSGTLIPGHGGVLDRIDALLLAGPVYLVFFIIFLKI